MSAGDSNAQSWFDALSARGTPCLTWLDGTGSRLELTGTVLANWVSKSAGLLADLGAGPEVPLAVVSDPHHSLHWRSFACHLAALASGTPVHIVTEPADALDGDHIAIGPAVEVELVNELSAAAAEVLLFDLAPLALQTQVPAGFTDFISAVRSYPDSTVFPVAARPRWIVAGTCAVGDWSSAGTAEELTWSGLPKAAEDWAGALPALLGGGLFLAPPLSSAG